MTNIGLLGDLHGSADWLINRGITFYKRHNVTKIVQVGDFGIWPGNAGGLFAKRVNLALEKAGMTLYVIPGNHDDYDQINALPVADDGWQHFRTNILLAPRGYRWEWEGRTFVGLGGAPSVDRSWRLEQMGRGGIYRFLTDPTDADLPKKGRVWWPAEAITEEDVERTVAGGYADVMIGHDAPIISGIDKRIAGNPYGFQQHDLDYAAEGRKLMHRAAHGVMPKLFFAGHYHFFVDEVKHWASADTGYFSTRDIIGTTRVIVLDKDYQHNSLGVLDLETLEPKIGLHH